MPAMPANGVASRAQQMISSLRKVMFDSFVLSFHEAGRLSANLIEYIKNFAFNQTQDLQVFAPGIPRLRKWKFESCLYKKKMPDREGRALDLRSN